MVEFQIPLRTVSALNAREHWSTRSRRVKRERATTAVCLAMSLGTRQAPRVMLPAGRLLVTLTRAGPRAMDFDNAISGLKGVRDELALWLGVDDGDGAKVEWAYRMAKGPYVVRVRIEAHPDAELSEAKVSDARLRAESAARTWKCVSCDGRLSADGSCPYCAREPLVALVARTADKTIRRRS